MNNNTKVTFDYSTFINMCKKYMKIKRRPLDFKKHKNHYFIDDNDGKEYDISANYLILKEKVENNELNLTQENIKDALLLGIDLTHIVYQGEIIKD